VTEFVDSLELLRTVQEFLQRIAATSDAKSRFEAQVATYLLDMVMRELRGHESTGADVVDAQDVARLCAEIRSGSRDALWNETVEEVLTSTVLRVRIVRPDHLSAEHGDA